MYVRAYIHTYTYTQVRKMWNTGNSISIDYTSLLIFSCMMMCLDKFMWCLFPSMSTYHVVIFLPYCYDLIIIKCSC